MSGNGKRDGGNGENAVRENLVFRNLATEAIRSLTEVRAKSTIDNYRTALHSFLCFAGDDLMVENIDRCLIEGYQSWLFDHDVSQNTISCYMRSLRALFHQVLSETKWQSLFEMVFTGKMRTDKRSIPLEEIMRIQRLQLYQIPSLAFSRDLFLFCFYALGMPFVDAAFLQKKQVSDGYIVYHRHKTGQRIRVKVETPMQQIIDRYACEGTPYVFPILTTQDKSKAMVEYENARSRYNRHLKKIGEMAGVRRPLTSYVARHSWASMAYHSNVDLSVISKALGHTSPNTTLTYIREIDDNRIDTANKDLLRRISSSYKKAFL